MSQHYYLIASLPALSLGATPPLAEVTLRALVGEHLAARDVAEFDAILAGGGVSTFAAAWRQAMHHLDNARVLARASRRGVDAAASLEDIPVPELSIAAAVQDALGAQDPREREWRLDALRLRLLDDLTLTAPFSTSAVFAYGLRLSICARQAARGVEAGRQSLRHHLQQILGAFDS